MRPTIISAPVFLSVLPPDAVVTGREHTFAKNTAGSWDCLTDRTYPRLTAEEMPHTVTLVSVPAHTFACGCTDHACATWGCGGCHKRAKNTKPTKRKRPVHAAVAA